MKTSEEVMAREAWGSENLSTFGRIWQNGCSCTNGRWSSVSPALGSAACLIIDEVNHF